jgi:hypothetical protein
MGEIPVTEEFLRSPHETGEIVREAHSRPSADPSLPAANLTNPPNDPTMGPQSVRLNYALNRHQDTAKLTSS